MDFGLLSDNPGCYLTSSQSDWLFCTIVCLQIEGFNIFDWIILKGYFDMSDLL
jgi:hypothetical protein